MGRLVLAAGTVPTLDAFAWTPKLTTWIDHEWLAGVIFYLLYQCGGEWLLFLFKVLLAALTITLLRGCYQLGAKFQGVGLCALGLAFFGSAFLWFGTVRSQVFTYLFLTAAYYAILRHRTGAARRPLIFMLALMPLWANLHGGFVLGLIALGVYAAARLSKRDRDIFPLIIFAAAALSTLLNPYGLEYWDFIISALSKARPRIAEWSAVNPFSLRGLVISLFLLLVAVYQLQSRKRHSPESYLMLIFSMYSGFRHARLIPLGLFTAVAFFPQAFDNFEERTKNIVRYLFLDRILSALAVLLIIPACWSFAVFLRSHSDFKLNYARYPVQAVTWAKENLPPGKVLNPFNEGSYVLWAGHSHLLVSIDGRYEEVYPEETFETNARIFSAGTANRAELVNRLNPDYVLVPNSGQLASESFGTQWRQVYSDPLWKILAK